MMEIIFLCYRKKKGRELHIAIEKSPWKFLKCLHFRPKYPRALLSNCAKTDDYVTDNSLTQGMEILPAVGS